MNLSLAVGAALDAHIVAVLDPRGSVIIGGAEEIGVAADDLKFVVGGAGDVALADNLKFVVEGALSLPQGVIKSLSGDGDPLPPTISRRRVASLNPSRLLVQRQVPAVPGLGRVPAHCFPERIHPLHRPIVLLASFGLVAAAAAPECSPFVSPVVLFGVIDYLPVSPRRGDSQIVDVVDVHLLSLSLFGGPRRHGIVYVIANVDWRTVVHRHYSALSGVFEIRNALTAWAVSELFAIF